MTRGVADRPDASEESGPNVELLKTTLAQVEANSQGFNPRCWRCENCMSFEAWAAQAAGGTWICAGPDRAWEDWYDCLVAEPDDDASHVYDIHGMRVIEARDRASQLLRLSPSDEARLFSEDNTLGDLRRIVGEICEGVS